MMILYGINIFNRFLYVCILDIYYISIQLPDILRAFSRIDFVRIAVR